MINIPQNILAQGDISDWLTSIFFLGFMSAFHFQSHDMLTVAFWAFGFQSHDKRFMLSNFHFLIIATCTPGDSGRSWI